MLSGCIPSKGNYLTVYQGNYLTVYQGNYLTVYQGTFMVQLHHASACIYSKQCINSF